MVDEASGRPEPGPECLPERLTGGDPPRSDLACNCYDHRKVPASYLCEYCGKALCGESVRLIEGHACCGQCDPVKPQPAYICGRCGWLAYDALPGCPHCALTQSLRRRGGEQTAEYWERRFTGFDPDNSFWTFLVVSLAVYGTGLGLGFPLASRGVELSPLWWAFLAVVSGGCGVMAVLLARRASRYELLLSQDGLEVLRRRKRVLFLRWQEVLGLELQPERLPTHFVVYGPGRQIVLQHGLLGSDDALILVRQYAAAVPPPLAWGADEEVKR
jgi:hypothetical protein